VSDPLPKIPSVTPFPDDLESETDMVSWRLLFKKRKQWAEYILSHAEGLTQKIEEADAATKITRRSVTVAFQNLETHSAGLGNSLAKLRKWAEGVVEDRDKVLASWEPAVKQLLRIPVHDEFKKFGEDQDQAGKKFNVLASFIDVKEVQQAAATSAILAERFEKDVKDLGNTIEDICSRTGRLKMAVQQGAAQASVNTGEQLGGLLEEASILVEKIQTDNEYARGLQGPKSASAASKRAFASTTEYLPGLVAVASDIGRLYTTTIERKVGSFPHCHDLTAKSAIQNVVSAACHENLQNIAVIQSMSAPVNPQINKLDTAYQEEDGHFHLLSLVLRLPTSYGSLLVECVRRREWSEKFSSSSQKLAEELALMKEDEEKRRRKWQRNTGVLLPFSVGDTSQIVRAELNTRGDPSGGLPQISRKDVEDYISTLRSLGGLENVVKELALALQEVDKPSRRIAKRMKGFKMGSVHEANMTGSSFLARHDEENKILRAEKDQLSERIKGYESRIRKLEDLLHRGRTTSGNPYQANASPQTSTMPQDSSANGQPAQSPDRPPSSNRPGMQHRRSSSEAYNSTEQFKARIAQLEAELAAEKEKASRLEREATENTESEKVMNALITQADETKRDLVANLEATVQQNINERKALTCEIGDLKLKLEEAYEELDRVEEEKVKLLEGELESLGGELAHIRLLHEQEALHTQELAEALATAQREKENEISALRVDLESQVKSAEKELKRAEEAEVTLAESAKATVKLADEKASIQMQLRQAQHALDDDRITYSSSQSSLMDAMKRAYGHLSSDTPPEDLPSLISEVENLAARAVGRDEELTFELESQKKQVESLKRDREFLGARFDSRTLRAKDLTQRLYTHNARSIQLLESLGFRIVRGDDSMQIVKISRSSTNNNDSTVLNSTAGLLADPHSAPSSPLSLAQTSTVEDINLLYWMESPDSDTESEKYSQYLRTIGALDLDAFSEAVINRVKKAEQDARQLMKQGRAYREKFYRARDEASEKIAFKSFKQGDLALFLPTRNQVTRPWAAFNVGAPHFFLREQDSHKLATRDWLLARITKVEERVVDLSRSTASVNLPQGIDRSSISSERSLDDENPFELSDGLRWYLLDAVEEKPGAPSTPGLSSSTVASANVDAKGSLKSRKPITGAKKKLSEITTEHSRRSSSGSGNRILAPLSTEAIAAVRAVVEGRAGDTIAVESVPSTPRTPVEKIAAGVRSRAGSIRSRTPAPETGQR
jgi:autophagy-related protein 11